MTEHARVDEVDTRRFYETLAEVLEIRSYDEDEPRGLEHAQPLRDRRNGDAERRRELRLVQHLPASAGKQREKRSERAEVANGRHGTNVSLQVRLHVRAKPRRRIART